MTPEESKYLADAVTVETERLLRIRATARGEDDTARGWLFGAFAMAFMDGTMAEALGNVKRARELGP